MIIDFKELTLFNKKFAEYIKVKPPFKIHTSMPDEACFIYMKQGMLKVTTEIDTFESSNKDTLLLKCGNYIGQMLPTSAPEYEAIVIHFYPEILEKVFSDGITPGKLKHNPEHKAGIKINNDELLEKFMNSLLFYFNNPALADEDLLILKIKELVLILNKIRDNKIVQQLYNYLFDPGEFSFKDVIKTHMYSEMGLEDLAHLTNRSLSSFKRDFKKYYQTSPSKYIKTKKLEKAAGLLKNSSIGLTDIMFECGFNNASHFTKIFKERYSETPTQFRLSQTEH